MHMRIKTTMLFMAALLTISLSFGQSKPGIIAGSVKDSRTKSPLIEAVITVSSPALQGQKFALTDSTGFYKIANLPPGLYTVSFEMEGFRKYSQENVLLSDGMSLGVSMEMAKDRGAAEAEKAKKRNKVDEIVTTN